MLSGSFSIFKWPGSPIGANEYLEIVVEDVVLVSCQDIVTLNAIVLGDMDGHTFLWEQIGGPPVTWLEPQNQLMVMYQKNPSESGQDCFFRFWADKNTPFEQYKDMVVSGIARDDSNFVPRIKQLSYGTREFVDVTFRVSPGFTYAPNYTLNNPTRVFTFNLAAPPFTAAPFPAAMTKNIVYTYDNGVYTPYVQLPPDGTLVLNADPTKKYVVRYFYDYYNITNNYFESKTALTLNDAIISNTLDTGEIVPRIGSYNNVSTGSFYLVSLVELTQQVLQENVTGYNNNIKAVDGPVSYYQVQLTTLFTIPDSLQDTILGLNTVVGRFTGTGSYFQVQLSDGITVIG